MISKQLKNTYYVEIINIAANLLDEYKKMESNTLKDPLAHEFLNIKKEVSSLNRIYNNALIILLRNGMKFSTGSDKWTGCNKAIICINGKKHEVTMQNVKTILGGGYERILDECFATEPYDNIVKSSIQESEIRKSYSSLFETFSSITFPHQEDSDYKKKALVETETEPVKQNLSLPKKQPKKTEEKQTAVIPVKNKSHIQNKKNKQIPLAEKRAGNVKTLEKIQNDKKREDTKKNTDVKTSKEKIGGSTETIKANKADNKKSSRKVEESSKPKQKVPIFDDIDEFFDEIGEDISITSKPYEKKTEKTPHIIRKPVMAMDFEPKKPEKEKTKSIIKHEAVEFDDMIEIPYTDMNEDILQIDDEEDIPSMTTKEEEDINVGAKDLLMDVYKIKKVDPESNETKEFTILVAPLNNPGHDEFKSPIFAFGRTGRISSISCSTTSDKPLIQLIIDGEAFIIRGSWSEGDFVSLVYPQNVDNQNISVTNIKKMRPEEKGVVGHNLFHVQGLKFHILPLASANNKYDYASFIMCVENMSNNKYEMAELMRGNNVMYKYSDNEYKVFAKWVDEKLIHKLL